MNSRIILLICILVVIVSIIYVILSFRRLRIKNSLEQYTPTNNTMFSYDQLKHLFKSGDIILFACDKFGNIKERILYTCRTLSIGCNYGHVGLVLKYNNKLYLLECCDYDQPGYQYSVYINKSGKNSGVRITKLRKALKAYQDECGGHFSVKFISQEIKADKLISTASRYSKTTFQSRFVLIMLGLTDVLVSHKFATILSNNITTDEKMICTEFLYLVLTDCKVLDKTYGKLLWPHVICGRQFSAMSIVKYSGIIKFKFY